MYTRTTTSLKVTRRPGAGLGSVTRNQRSGHAAVNRPRGAFFERKSSSPRHPSPSPDPWAYRACLANEPRGCCVLSTRRAEPRPTAVEGEPGSLVRRPDQRRMAGETRRLGRPSCALREGSCGARRGMCYSAAAQPTSHIAGYVVDCPTIQTSEGLWDGPPTSRLLETKLAGAGKLSGNQTTNNLPM